MVDLKSTVVEKPLEAGVLVRLSDRVRRITAANGGPMTGAGTNGYVVGERELAVIDPGPLDEAHVEAIIAQAGGVIRWVLVTHTHSDHSPAAKLLAERTGAELIGCVMEPTDGHQDSSFEPTITLQDQQTLATPEFTLTAVYTPGHVGNHFCFWLPEDGMMFTGDHLMQGTTVVIIPPSGDMADYIASLEKLNDYPVKYLAPGHGHLMADAPSVVSGLIRHRTLREVKVVSALKKLGEVSMETLVAEVYKDVDPSLHPIALYSLWAHLLKLEKEQRAQKHAEPDCLFGQELWKLSTH